MTPQRHNSIAKLMLSSLGTFWTDVYGGSRDVRVLTEAITNCIERVDSIVDRITPFYGAKNVEAFDTWNWYSLYFAAADRKQHLVYDSGLTYDDNATYGTAQTAPVTYPIASNIVAINQLISRRESPTAWFFQGQDYEINSDDHTICFVEDPLTDSRFVSTLDQSDIRIWGYGTELDTNYTYDYVGYISGYRERKNTKSYLNFAKALVPMLVDGPTSGRFDEALIHSTDYPLARATETVIDISRDHIGKLIVTDANVYRIPNIAEIIVTVGQELAQGDSLCDALIVHEFNRGTLPPDCDYIMLGPEQLGGQYPDGLCFRNSDLPTIVSTVDGKTRIRFQIDGLPDQVEQFWEQVTAAENALGRTVLEYLLDRDNPPEGSAPATINPASFIAQHILRWGGVRIVCRTNPQNHLLSRRLSTTIGLGSAMSRFIVTLVGPSVTDSISAGSDSISHGDPDATIVDTTPAPIQSIIRPIATEPC